MSSEYRRKFFRQPVEYSYGHVQERLPTRVRPFRRRRPLHRPRFDQIHVRPDVSASIGVIGLRPSGPELAIGAVCALIAVVFWRRAFRSD